MATSTPWGPSQHSKKYGRGIIFYGTAGHGGFHVSRTLNVKIPQYLRNEDGWYEEDCEYAKVVIAFPDRFPDDTVKHATESLRGWNPDAYEAHFGVVLGPGESYIKDQRRFQEDHKNDLVVVSAYGDHQPGVPSGFVGVVAYVGGRDANYQFKGEPRYFLVPDEEYTSRRRYGFAVDLERHQEVTANWASTKRVG